MGGTEAVRLPKPAMPTSCCKSMFKPRSVLAHLIHMVGAGRVQVDGGGAADEAAVYRL
jgi:hypothetical protein